TTRSPIEIVPEVMFSRPASMRRSVDLPQPEGPTRTTNWPSSIGIETPCRTSKLPNDFRTSRICTDDIHSPPKKTRGPMDLARLPPFSLGGVLAEFFAGVVGSKSYTIPASAAVAVPVSACKVRPLIKKMPHENKACALREKP